MRRRRQERETSQRSVSYALDFFGKDPIIRGHADYFRGMYTHMLLEDVGLLLIPTARGPKSQFKASLRPENQNIEELVHCPESIDT
jgi:translation elongation factor EF-Tu-like GTPase